MGDPIFSKTFSHFLSSTANRTTANKQEAPRTQPRARECGEGVVYTPRQQHNSHIPSPPPRCVSRKTESVCKLCKSGAVGRVPGTTSTTRSGGRGRRRSCLLPRRPSSTSPSTRAKLPKAGLAPQPEQRQRGADLHLLYPGSWSLIDVPRQGTVRNTFPERAC